MKITLTDSGKKQIAKVLKETVLAVVKAISDYTSNTTSTIPNMTDMVDFNNPKLFLAMQLSAKEPGYMLHVVPSLSGIFETVNPTDTTSCCNPRKIRANHDYLTVMPLLVFTATDTSFSAKASGYADLQSMVAAAYPGGLFRTVVWPTVSAVIDNYADLAASSAVDSSFGTFSYICRELPKVGCHILHDKQVVIKLPLCFDLKNIGHAVELDII